MSYAELHCKTNFSFLEGASHPEELVTQAAVLGLAALAITDNHSLAGVVRAHTAARQQGLKLLIGAEVWPVDAFPLVLLATDRASYGRLARLLTVGRRRADKGECHLLFADIAAHAEGLVACVPLSTSSTSCIQRTEEARAGGLGGWDRPQARLSPDDRAMHRRDGGVAARENGTAFSDLSGGDSRGRAHKAYPAIPHLRAYRELFGERCYALAEVHKGPDDAGEVRKMAALAREANLPLVAGGDVHYHDPRRRLLHDVLVATRLGCTLVEARQRLFPNAEHHLKSAEQVRYMFREYPDAVARTLEVAGLCNFSLAELRYEYPEELSPPGETPMEFLARLTWAGAEKRYPQGVPRRVRQLLAHELALIRELGYEAYFLTVWDLVRFARSRGILCQGRGSAANSAVCYCLGITAVDPERMDVLFERFVSRERQEAPDIDVDFEHERREEVIQYVYEKYGRERAGMTAEVICYRMRSAVRDVGKALGLSVDRLDTLAKYLDGRAPDPDLGQRLRDVGLDPDSVVGGQLRQLVAELVGFPRHLSQHVGGLVITRGPLCEVVPLENAAMPGRTVIQWNKDDLDDLGILKVDCLALGMLTAIHKAFNLIERHHGRRLTLGGIPEGDQRVYDMICRADTMGVFQIESRAQMSMLPRLQPRCFHDLVVEVAIVRPGPIQGNMVHPYLRRRAGLEQVTYPNDAIRQVLEKTLGVPLFQEQAMRLAVVAAGFTPGEADQLRRAMAAWRRPGLIGQFRERLLRGMQARGLEAEFAEQVFNQIRGFGEYGFPESHAASFALLVYVSAWLKHYYPAAFAAAVVNSQPMGFYSPAQLIRDAREHGVEVRPIDVNHSDWDCTLETTASAAGNGHCRPAGHGEPLEHAGREAFTPQPPAQALRLGFRLVSGLSKSVVAAIERARRQGAFHSLHEFARRTNLARATMLHLAAADVFRSLGLGRREALWYALSEEKVPRELPLLDHLPLDEEPPVRLAPMSETAQVVADYQVSGLTLRTHPIAFFRDDLKRLGAATAAELKALPQDRPVQVAGLVLVRQRPSTARGITFVTLEDETGTANLVVHPGTWRRFYRAARTAAALLARGRLQREGPVIHVVVTQLEDLSARIRGLRSQSRDFH